MLYFISRVGNNYGVIDTDDGIIEWVSQEQLLDYAKQVEIVGAKDMKPVPCTIESGKCNWSKGYNIFTSLKELTCANNKDFVIYTVEGKKYKGEVLSVQGEHMLHFTCHVFVPISEFVYRLFKGGSSTRQQLVEKLRASGGQSLS